MAVQDGDHGSRSTASNGLATLLLRLGAFPLLLVTLGAVTTSAAAVSASNIPTCIPDDVLSGTFCLSPEERARGEVPVHSPTTPDSVFIDSGISLTLAPGDRSRATVTEQEAVHSLLLNDQLPNSAVHSAFLGEYHVSTGIPTTGPLVWVIDITPSTGVPITDGGPGYVFVIVPARKNESGYLDGFGYYTGVRESGIGQSVP